MMMALSYPNPPGIANAPSPASPIWLRKMGEGAGALETHPAEASRSHALRPGVVGVTLADPMVPRLERAGRPYTRLFL